MRNTDGTIGKGGIELTPEQKLKKSQSLSLQWKTRDNYIGDIVNKNPRIYNVWRSFMFTQKGLKIGHCEKWNNFSTFYYDVVDSYHDGLVFRRKDITKPYSPENFVWVTKSEAGDMRANTMITIGEQTLNIRQWSEFAGVTINAIKNRYYKHKNDYTPTEIVYGRKVKRGTKKAKDISDPSVKIRAKASKMISSYKCKDKKFEYKPCDITIDWMIDNILTKKCVYCGDNKRIGCDRIDNNKGHTMDNVVPCCVECNAARNNYFSYAEMKILGKIIREIKKSRTKQ